MTEERKRVLVVDDERYNINLMVELLRTDYDVMVAKNGEVALKRLRSDTPPDLILLDIMMPDMDGYEVCRRIKADDAIREIPVIFVTAMGSDEDESKGLALGAVDYITKPISPSIVVARIKTHMALRQAFRDLELKNAALRYERDVVECVVERLSQSALFDGSHLRVLRSAVDHSSGDVLFSAFGPHGRQHILLGDFTGHGLTAAIGGPMVSDIFYSRTLMGGAMEQIMAEINQVLCEKLPDHMFMVGCFIEISSDRKEVTVWNCGMPDVLLLRAGRLEQSIASGFLPRGLLVRPEKPGSVLRVTPGDLLFAYTDGIVEEINCDHLMFGTKNLHKVLEDVIASGQSLDRVLDALERYRGGGSQRDDIMLIEMAC